ncbi:MAG: hypothetical protein AB1652_02040 [Bacillota bacterium]
MRDIDKNGMAALPGEDGDAGFARRLDWQFLEEVAGKYPQSYLARGIKAYEEVRGEPYFELARREKYQKDWGVYSYGDEQYDPEREIPGWEKFLQEFSRHPFAGLTVPAGRSVRHPRRHRLRPVWYLLALLPAVAE